MALKHWLSERYIRFADVDAAGWLYYPRFFQFCHNAFEDWINTQAPLNYIQMIEQEHFGFPAVSAKGDYLAPLKHGNTVIIQLKILCVGNSSLKTGFEFTRKHDQQPCFKAEITTVCVNIDQGKPMPIPDIMREFFQKHE